MGLDFPKFEVKTAWTRASTEQAKTAIGVGKDVMSEFELRSIIVVPPDGDVIFYVRDNDVWRLTFGDLEEVIRLDALPLE